MGNLCSVKGAPAGLRSLAIASRPLGDNTSSNSCLTRRAISSAVPLGRLSAGAGGNGCWTGLYILITGSLVAGTRCVRNLYQHQLYLLRQLGRLNLVLISAVFLLVLVLILLAVQFPLLGVRLFSLLL